MPYGLSDAADTFSALRLIDYKVSYMCSSFNNGGCIVIEEKIRVPKTANDWNELWKAKQLMRMPSASAADWDKRSATFGNKDYPDSYTEKFIELAAIKPGETVFDMGCGTGALALPLGAAGHKVLAADFSQGMLDRLESQLSENTSRNISPIQLSWEEDWTGRGVLPESYDICIASRSIAVNDLKAALEKLTGVARRRVCVTVATGASPRIDERILPILGIESAPSMDDVYILAILNSMGFLPEIAYIQTSRNDVFDSFEEALDRYTQMAKMALDAAGSSENESAISTIRKELSEWMRENLESCGNSQNPNAVQFATPRKSSWAFISWNKG